MELAFILFLLVGTCVSLLPFPGHWGYNIDVIEEVTEEIPGQVTIRVPHEVTEEVPSQVTGEDHSGTFAECPPPWFRVGDECFRTDAIIGGHNWTREGHNFTSARTYCADEAPGGDLAQPNDIKALVDYMENHGMGGGYEGTWYWLGGSDLATEDDWRWLNGSIIERGWQKAANWNHSPRPHGPPSVRQDQPNNYRGDQDCLAMEVFHKVPGGSSLGDMDCRLTSFICERPLV